MDPGSDRIGSDHAIGCLHLHLSRVNGPSELPSHGSTVTCPALRVGDRRYSVICHSSNYIPVTKSLVRFSVGVHHCRVVAQTVSLAGPGLSRASSPN
eukprot:763828-Hanusia_phi.AAC.1